jgi:hypothetical protein
MHRSKYLINRKKIKLSQSWKTLSRDDKSDLTRFLKIMVILIAVIALLYYAGISGLTHIGNFWALLTGDRGETQGDTTAPPPPTFSPLPSYTKVEKISISGFAEPASEVTLLIDGQEAVKTIGEAGGTFNFAEVTLPTEGKNTLTATAADRAGNVSQKSAELIITLDKTPPEIEVSSPQNGQAFSGENNQIHVEGKTEPGITVRVNEIQAAMLADGTFRATLTASAGEIKITIMATDKAGNEKKVELKVTFSP